MTSTLKPFRSFEPTEAHPVRPSSLPLCPRPDTNTGRRSQVVHDGRLVPRVDRHGPAQAVRPRRLTDVRASSTQLSEHAWLTARSAEFIKGDMYIRDPRKTSCVPSTSLVWVR